MDPNETLRLMRESITKAYSSSSRTERDGHMADVVMYAEALDKWLTKGGLLPLEWDRVVAE